jgi:hypothetical protein
MKLTGAAILVSRGMKFLQAAPAAYPYRSASEEVPEDVSHRGTPDDGTYADVVWTQPGGLHRGDARYRAVQRGPRQASPQLSRLFCFAFPAPIAETDSHDSGGAGQLLAWF